GVYRIGSSPASHIQFSRPEISARHAILTVTDGLVKIADCGSSNGTYLDGERIGADPVEVPIGSTITIASDVHIILLEKQISFTQYPPNANVSMATHSSLSDPKKKEEIEREIKKVESSKTSNTPPEQRKYSKIPVIKISGIDENARPIVQEIKRHAHVELLKRLNLKRMALSGASEDQLAEKARTTIHEIMKDLSVPLPPGVTIEKIERELVHEAIGLGPLEDLIDVPEITEIMVNGPNNVYIEKDGVIYRTDTAFADDNQVLAAIERIVSPLGRRIDESSPMVDARLKDGSRVNAIIPPLSLVGPSITIRKFSKTPFQVHDLIRFGSLTNDMARFLDACVQIRKNIIISGGTGSGKTTLLNVLSSFLPPRERIITIEDAAELQLKQEHVVRLEARPPNIEGKGEITIRDLVRNSLRMRPDRIVVGECRGGEALDMLQAMNTGHDGSLTTIHANSPRDALARLETLVLMAGFDLPLRAIREQIASAITIIVQVDRMKDGSRKITQISEITKMEGDVITMQDIFEYKHEGWTPDGKMIGRHVPCGNIPTFMEEIQRAKIDIDISIFNDRRII
ncbi:MAG TPA: ATPase, T2SS/T4P/T4SS family, partial [Victivallales bacterium]|nr:ATPase, T2SS/T4P/T4SS family [Victivallales bacterium]